MPVTPSQTGQAAGNEALAPVLGPEDRDRLMRLILQLKTDDLDLLNETVQQLSQQADIALPLMLEALVTAEEEVRKNLAWVLGFLRRPEALKPLFHLLSSDSSFDVRLSASWALRQMPLNQLSELIFTKLEPPGSREDVLAYLDSKSWKARWFCTVYLTYHPGPDGLESLLKLARSDDKVVVRCSSILTLTAYDDERVPAMLCQLLHDIDDHVKIESATVLSLRNHRAALPELAKQLRAYNENVRVSVISAIGALGDQQSVPQLATALKDPSELVRINAAMALFDIAQRLRRPHQGLRDLGIKALRDPNVYVVKNAARTLGFVGDEDTLRQIIALLKQETRPALVANLVQALGVFADARSVKVLARLMRHDSWEVRFEVVRALGLVRGAEREVYSLLLQGLKDPAVMVKEQAIHALGLHGNKKAIPHLEKLKMQHPYGAVNKTIAKVLDRLLEL